MKNSIIKKPIFFLALLFSQVAQSQEPVDQPVVGEQTSPQAVQVPQNLPVSVQNCPVPVTELDEKDMEIAQQAWKYFENNRQETTGLVNAVDGYPSTTLWDSGSALAAFIAAESLGIITTEQFDEWVRAKLDTLANLDLFFGEAPNKVYHTETAAKVDYGNNATEAGIGISILDLARIASWLNILSCLHPQYKEQAVEVLESWSYCRLIDKGQMFGMRLKEGEAVPTPEIVQEGRLGYEQYAAKIFGMLGFDQSISSNYWNRNTEVVDIFETPIAVDKRDSSTLGAYNYVVTESYVMDIMENGTDEVIAELAENILEVQFKRYQQTGQVTAVSEDNLDRAPYFVYNTIYTDKQPWKALTDVGDDMAHMKSVSSKAAFSMAYVFKDHEYSQVLINTVWDARNPKGGWFSGIYEDDKGFNKATTANTNGVILSAMMYKKFGSLNQLCSDCNKGLNMFAKTLASNRDKAVCMAELPQRVAAAEQRAQVAKQKQLAKVLEARIKKINQVADNFREADKLVAANDLAKAAETISNTKGDVWALGDAFPEEKEKFQGLMGPIDALAGQWQSGNQAANSAEILTQIEAIIERIRASHSVPEVAAAPATETPVVAESTGAGTTAGAEPAVSAADGATQVAPVVAAPATAAADSVASNNPQTDKIKSVVDELNAIDAMRVGGNAVEAAQKIASLKGKIWALSDEITEVQSELQALMAPLDYIANQWNDGNTEIDTKGVQSDLTTIINKLSGAEVTVNTTGQQAKLAQPMPVE